MESSKVIAIVVGALVALLVMSALIGGGSSESADNNEQPQVQTEQQPALATRVESEFREFLGLEEGVGYSTFDTGSYSAIRYIGGFEDVSSGTVRVFIQDDITKEQSEDVGKTILGAVGLDIAELDVIVVRATDGRDVNVFRESVPILR